MFLMETHLDDFPAECLRRRLKMDHKYVVRSNGQCGGLVLYWKKEIAMLLRDKNNNFIDVFIGSGADNFWRFTDMYGEPKWADKHLTWERIRELRALVDMPWMLAGDLNDIMYSFEKEGGNPRPPQYMAAFRDALDESGLLDLGYYGDKFTWHGGQIRERLDRAVANNGWNAMFPAARVEHLEYYKSDHPPLIISLEEEIAQESNRSAVLRFEARWFKEANFKQVVEDAWMGLGAEA